MKTNPSSFKLSLSRRQMLRAAAIGAPFTSGLVADLAAQTASDYKALICLNMGGGNDSLSSIVPYDTNSYNAYKNYRSGVFLERSLLKPATPLTSQGGLEVGFSPNLTGAASLFEAGRLAIIPSVGPLIEPVTLTSYRNGTARLPAFLFSHFDQLVAWQANDVNGERLGWCGQFGDELFSGNGVAQLTSISAAGHAYLMQGKRVSLFGVNDYGVPNTFFTPGSNLDALYTGSARRTNLIEQAYSSVHERLRDGATALNQFIADPAALPPLPSGNTLVQQLNTIARIIAGRNGLQAKRQVFFIQLTGFDTHSSQTSQHPKLMSQVDEALTYFDSLMTALALKDKVTLFTMAEFGRNLISNGDGTDHAWGAHHMVVGPVKARDIFGKLPVIGINNPDFTENGAMIPRIAVAQYGATLAKWFGLSDSQISSIFPTLSNFSTRDLGFL